jgi:hypothetical protein
MSTATTLKASISMLALLGFLGAGFFGVAYGYQHHQLNLSGTGLDVLYQQLGFVPEKQPPIGTSAVPLPAPAQAATTELGLPEEVSLSISSDPLAVEIYIDNAFVGEAPKLLRYPKSDREVELLFRKQGFVEAKQRIRLQRSQPLIVKLAPEATKKKTAPAASTKSASPKESTAPENKPEKLRKAVLERLENR